MVARVHCQLKVTLSGRVQSCRSSVFLGRSICNHMIFNKILQTQYSGACSSFQSVWIWCSLSKSLIQIQLFIFFFFNSVYKYMKKTWIPLLQYSGTRVLVRSLSIHCLVKWYKWTRILMMHPCARLGDLWSRTSKSVVHFFNVLCFDFNDGCNNDPHFFPWQVIIFQVRVCC